MSRAGVEVATTHDVDDGIMVLRAGVGGMIPRRRRTARNGRATTCDVTGSQPAACAPGRSGVEGGGVLHVAGRRRITTLPTMTALLAMAAGTPFAASVAVAKL
jgi:hypothetical protein